MLKIVICNSQIMDLTDFGFSNISPQTVKVGDQKALAEKDQKRFEQRVELIRKLYAGEVSMSEVLQTEREWRKTDRLLP